MSEKKKESFIDGFKKADIKQSAEMNIKPKLGIEALGIENSVQVEILSEPYKVEVGEKALTDDGMLWMIDMLYQNVEHQFIAQPASFRYHYAVATEKETGNPEAYNKMIGKSVKIWKAEATSGKWKGQAMYHVEVIKD